MGVGTTGRAAWLASIGGYVLPSYTALMTLVLNLIVAIVLTPIFNAMGAERLPDETRIEHYG